MLSVTAPTALNGASLRQELAAAGLAVGDFDMTLIGDDLHFATLGEQDRPTVEGVVAAHTGEPPAEVQAAEAAAEAVDAVVTQMLAKARTIMANPQSTTDWTTAERKVLLAAVVLGLAAE